PQPEMNTFLTAMMVDLLSPLARERNFEDVLKRARRHLGDQIEETGLVRYHGLPDAPTIGTLGCAITPDADDTALAWRISSQKNSGANRHRVLKTLAQYRAARGLYRTWLAPQKEYQNLDPGLDPNPADFTIQMNILLMLREFDPAAARSLAEAIARA